MRATSIAAGQSFRGGDDAAILACGSPRRLRHAWRGLHLGYRRVELVRRRRLHGESPARIAFLRGLVEKITKVGLTNTRTPTISRLARRVNCISITWTTIGLRAMTSRFHNGELLRDADRSVCDDRDAGAGIVYRQVATGADGQTVSGGTVPEDLGCEGKAEVDR